MAPPKKKRRRSDDSDDSDNSDSDDSSEDEHEAKVKQQLSSSGVLPGMSDEELVQAVRGSAPRHASPG